MNPQILFVGNHFVDQSKYGSVGRDLAASLADRKWGVAFLSERENKIARMADFALGPILRSGSFDIAQVDLFSGMAFTWGEAAATSLRILGKPFVISLHGGNLPAFANKWPRRVTRLLSMAAAVTSPSRYLARALQRYRHDIRVIPNLLDLGRYQYVQRDRVHPRLLWIRSFHSIYNPELLPAVVALLAGEFPEASATMVGPDKGDGSLRRTRVLAEKLGVAARIKFVGGISRERIPDWLSQHDIFLNTTNVDNTPVSLMEGLAAGLPVVSTNVGGIPDLLEDGVTGLLVGPNDAGALASAVRRLLTDPDLAHDLSVSGRELAEQCAKGRITDQWEDLLYGVLRQYSISDDSR